MHCLKGGHIVFNAGYSVFDCRIRDITDHGALIDVESVVGVPHEFDLTFDGRSHHCTTKWRNERRIGVAFVD